MTADLVYIWKVNLAEGIVHTTFGERTNGARGRQKNYFKKVQLTSDLKFAQEPLHKCLHIWSESNGRHHNWWISPVPYTHHILHVLVGHAAFGKRSNGGRRRQNKWLKKELQPAAGEENWFSK